MLKTRDLALFSVIALFLLAGIASTVTKEEMETEIILSDLQPATVIETVTVDSENKEPDRVSNIERLKAAIAKTGLISDASPSVPREEVIEEESEEVVIGGEIKENYCVGARDGLEVVSNWPIAGVELAEAEGSRVVREVVGDLVNPLLQLPINPVSGSATCLDTAVIGVTTSGSLLFNSDAIAYKFSGVDSLVGYARDGFPIYGQYSGAVDECGGYMSPTGYRYTVSSERNYFIGCYRGNPQPFNI